MCKRCLVCTLRGLSIIRIYRFFWGQVGNTATARVAAVDLAGLSIPEDNCVISLYVFAVLCSMHDWLIVCVCVCDVFSVSAWCHAPSTFVTQKYYLFVSPRCMRKVVVSC
jgi:hypothetical protein